MEQAFDSLASLITHVFKQLQTPLLSVDKIVEYINHNDFQVQIEKNGIVPSSTISKRAIINELQRCDIFVSSSPSNRVTKRPIPPPVQPQIPNPNSPNTINNDNSNQAPQQTDILHQQNRSTQHQQLWALRPNNPLYQCDAAIAASIEQMLTEHGPLTVPELVNLTQQMGADDNLFNRVLGVHADEFTINPEDGKIWFSMQPLPIRCNFESVEQALSFAFTIFQNGATIEELRKFLCLATHQGVPITRLCISHAFVQRPDIFVQIQRGRYAPFDSEVAQEKRRQEQEERRQQQSQLNAGLIGNTISLNSFNSSNTFDNNSDVGSIRGASLPSFRLLDNEEKAFDADEFFGGGFHFSSE